VFANELTHKSFESAKESQETANFIKSRANQYTGHSSREESPFKPNF